MTQYVRSCRPPVAGGRTASFAVLAILLLSLFCLIPATAMADCSDPAGVAGEQVYNTTHSTMQFCDGTNWYSMKGGAINEDTLADLSCAPNQIVKWDSVNWICSDGDDLTNLDASNLTSGTVPDARLIGDYSGLATVTAISFSGSHTGSGANLTDINASQLASGTVPDARLTGDYSGLGSITATAYYQSSDRNLKRDIKVIADPFALLEGIHGKHYIWKDSEKPAYGVIAQEVETVMPEAVSTNSEGIKAVDYGQLIAPLIEAVKLLKADNDSLREELRSQHEKVAQ